MAGLCRLADGPCRSRARDDRLRRPGPAASRARHWPGGHWQEAAASLASRLAASCTWPQAPSPGVPGPFIPDGGQAFADSSTLGAPQRVRGRGDARRNRIGIYSAGTRRDDLNHALGNGGLIPHRRNLLTLMSPARQDQRAVHRPARAAPRATAHGPAVRRLCQSVSAPGRCHMSRTSRRHRHSSPVTVPRRRGTGADRHRPPAAAAVPGPQRPARDGRRRDGHRGVRPLAVAGTRPPLGCSGPPSVRRYPMRGENSASRENRSPRIRVCRHSTGRPAA